MSSRIGINFSAVTRSRVIKDSNTVFYGLWIVNSVSKATIALIASGTSVGPLVATPGDIIIPRNVQGTNTSLAEILKLDNGIRCTDGLYLYFPGLVTSGCTALVAFA
jgi:hypothetical protein